MSFGMADVKKAFFKGRFAGRRYFIWAPPGFSTFPSEIWEVLVPIYGLTIFARLWYQCISEFLRQVGFEHYHGDPCLLRRLRGSGIVPPYPEHTDCPIWRRAAPNEPFEGHHVQTLSKGSTSRLPSPNVLEDPPFPLGGFGRPHGKYYYEIVFLYVDDTAIGSYDLPGVISEFSRRFEMTTGDNGSTFLGLNI
jgi:hypothetical protein